MAVPKSHRATPRVLKPGINVPLVAFFHEDTEELDIESTKSHVLRMLRAGANSITVQGSNGEACHLSHEERNLVTSTVRSVMDSEGFDQVPLIVGCGAQSIREAVSLCSDAALNGGDYALVLPPSYFRPAYTEKVLAQYFIDVAEESPIPILIYNYPTVVSGIDLSSNIITSLGKHKNIVGCKLTCGNTGKLNRVANSLHAATATVQKGDWMCFGGSADFTLQTLIAGGSGVITGLANIAPKACVKVFDLYKAGNWEEAQRIQAIVSAADVGVGEGGVMALKIGLQAWFAYGGVGRRPLPNPDAEEFAKYAAMFKEIVGLENSL